MRHILIFSAILFMACVIGGLGSFWMPENTSGTFNSDRFVSPESTTENLDTKRSDLSKHTETLYTDPEEFYQTIIENNIFRPLNWEPPQRASAYTLLGTTIATDSSNTEAYIQERKSNQFYAVSLGQQVGKMTVETITPKQVTLTQNGESLTLAMSSSQFLNVRGNLSISLRPDNSTPIIAEGTTKNSTDLTVSLETKHKHTPEEWRVRLEEKVKAIRSERIQMMDRLKYFQQK